MYIFSRGRQRRESTSFVLDFMMEASAAAVFNVTNIAQCILELISNSLNADATSIAIRIDREKRKIQVIDNGKGISKKYLETTAEYNNAQTLINRNNIQDIRSTKKQTLTIIRRLCDGLILTSRYYNSSKTYMKVFKFCQIPKIFKVQRRPCQGTTVSIYGFHELPLQKWDLTFMYNLVANVAIANPFVSFSVRDDQQKKVTMTITKPHNPIDIFKLLYSREVKHHNIWYINSIENAELKFCIYIGLTDIKSTATKNIFLNNKIVHCPSILQVVSTTFVNAFKCFKEGQCEWMHKKGAVFILLFIWTSEYFFTMENGKRTLMFSNIQCLLQDIRSKIFQICIEKVAPISMHNTSRKHKASIISCTNNINTPKLYGSTLSTQQLSVSQRNYTLRTFHRVISKKVTRLELHSQEKFTDNERILPSSNLINNLITPISQTKNIDKDRVTLTLSEWSNWTLPDRSKKKQFDDTSPRFYKRLDFLPKKLHKLLRGNTKLTNTNILNECNGSVLSDKLKFGLKNVLPHQEVDVRPCRTAERFREFTLKKEDLEFTRVLGQVNNELIVGLLIRNNRKVLLLMDQHAMHERIRYEHLLDKYKSQIRNELFSVKLNTPISIQLSVDSCNSLLSNKITLKKFGIIFEVSNNGIIMIHAVPECLRKNKYNCDELKLQLNIKNLLSELLESIARYSSPCSNLPFTIHNAIAMEACHGAIKFGDPLSLNQCRWLLKFIIETRAPTRCAHGRPSMVPILDLTDSEKRRGKTVQVSNTRF